MIEPELADGVELAAEPAGDDVYRDAALRQIADRRDLLGGERRVPWPGQDGGNDLERGRRGEQVVAERDGFVLLVGAVAGGEADLAQRIVEPGPLGDLGQLSIVFRRMQLVRCSMFEMTRPPETLGTQ